VPLPQVAAAIESGASPLDEIRPDLPPSVVDAVSSALAVDPKRRPSAEQLARDLRIAATSPRRDRTNPARKRKPAANPVAAASPLRLEQHLVPAGLAATTVVIGATLLPFWTPGLTILLALAAALATLRSPRLGLATALFVPVFPLGNVAQAAAVAYAALAVIWLALCWRDARAGLLFMAGPVLAAIGAIALLPLAVQPAHGRAHRALQAFAGVFAAVAVAGLRGASLPLTEGSVSNLGLDGSTSVSAVVGPIVALLQVNPWFVALATILAASAALLPDARKRGFRGIALLGLCQIGLIMFLAPTLSALSIVLWTLVLCAILAARTFQTGRYP